MGGEIFESHISTDTPEVGIHPLGQTALIKCSTTLPAQGLKGVGKIRVTEDLSGSRGYSLGEPDCRGIFEFFDQRFLRLEGL